MLYHHEPNVVFTRGQVLGKQQPLLRAHNSSRGEAQTLYSGKGRVGSFQAESYQQGPRSLSREMWISLKELASGNKCSKGFHLPAS